MISVIVDGLQQFMKRENLEEFENFFQISKISEFFFQDIKNPTFEDIDEKIQEIDSIFQNKFNNYRDKKNESFNGKNKEMKY